MTVSPPESAKIGQHHLAAIVPYLGFFELFCRERSALFWVEKRSENELHNEHPCLPISYVNRFSKTVNKISPQALSSLYQGVESPAEGSLFIANTIAVRFVGLGSTRVDDRLGPGAVPSSYR